MRLLVTGSRTWPEGQAGMIAATLLGIAVGVKDLTVVVGDCETGVDKIARDWATINKVETEQYPAFWDHEGKGAGPRRNQRMVDSRPDLCLGFAWGDLGNSRGTRDCVRRARTAGIPTYVVEWRG